ncbi:bifunctional diaminohydroxyphosphoribosylaminopyrimidine deaminase/5-amino-6-(5-phosphoribosylamino)uracil reductase RibD [Maritalea mediterranea]|uniref:Riboflavin biosynthesis protein RibD n=1 Tax=Maritalea mediterranea TaxID=2909667 RepID=A0ABS9EBI8_9HYPH|nr:bifunctional diaminohydroxyphosphoribosylaminopyrimidine deaminase/5-amino-6-(5-phosphoribosylamino)uracil reductase RibD [Maritalea mediterranea]MCF4099120.1 bifunctional diaminohydroxyphosphoribosylaminopyrimidine deaminase/5-amino-6-(5-phosphoribosylamino)uracil reductase RibD [Maritalea mediterranea]
MDFDQIAKTEFDVAHIRKAFRFALKAARIFEGATAPNPPVGCALLDAFGDILSIGAHQAAGKPHAERAALADLPPATNPHIAVVTLEPCAHFGRTPPCVDALIEAGVKEVWIGARDLNPRVEGGGAGKLRDAGIEVRFLSDLADEISQSLALNCQRLIAPFLHYAKTQRPFVTLKVAQDAAGSMIPPAGEKTFTRPSSLKFAHKLRRRADAILTGSGTILADDPHFTVRHVDDVPGKVRPLFILDRRGRVQERYMKAAHARGFVPKLVTDLNAALAELGARGCMEVLVEAGPELAAACREQKLVQLDITIERQAEQDCIRARYADDKLNSSSFKGEADVFGDY